MRLSVAEGLAMRHHGLRAAHALTAAPAALQLCPHCKLRVRRHYRHSLRCQASCLECSQPSAPTAAPALLNYLLADYRLADERAPCTSCSLPGQGYTTPRWRSSQAYFAVRSCSLLDAPVAEKWPAPMFVSSSTGWVSALVSRSLATNLRVPAAVQGVHQSCQARKH
jgi:hypothetical protein